MSVSRMKPAIQYLTLYKLVSFIGLCCSPVKWTTTPSLSSTVLHVSGCIHLAPGQVRSKVQESCSGLCPLGGSACKITFPWCCSGTCPPAMSQWRPWAHRRQQGKLELRSNVLLPLLKCPLLLVGLEYNDSCAVGKAHQVERGIQLLCSFSTTIFRDLTSVKGKNCEEREGTQQSNMAEPLLEAGSHLPAPHQWQLATKQPGWSGVS